MISSTSMRIPPFLSALAALPFSAYASTTAPQGYVLLEKIGSLQSVAPNSFSTYAQEFIYILVGISAALAVVMIVWGGFQYMLGDTAGLKSDGLNKVWGAAQGLLILLGSYLLLATINPALLSLRLTPAPTVVTGTAGVVTTVPQRTSQVSQQARGEWSTAIVAGWLQRGTDEIERDRMGINYVLETFGAGLYPATRAALESDRADITELMGTMRNSSNAVESAAGAVAQAEAALETTQDQSLEYALASAYQDLSAASNDLVTSGVALRGRVGNAIILTNCLILQNGNEREDCLSRRSTRTGGGPR